MCKASFDENVLGYRIAIFTVKKNLGLNSDPSPVTTEPSHSPPLFSSFYPISTGVNLHGGAIFSMVTKSNSMIYVTREYTRAH